MKEFIYGRNPVYETLQADRRQITQLLLADGVQEKSRLEEILNIARQHNLAISKVPRARLDKFSDSHQGIALEVTEYPYVN